MGIGKGGRDEEDAFGVFKISLRRTRLNLVIFKDMRKPLSRDPNRRSVRPNGRDMIVSAHDVS